MTLTLRPHQTKAVKAMLRNTKGQIIIPTGGGKTMCMIDDAMNEFSRTVSSQTIVVVAPRILLANQLSSEFLYHNLDGDYNITVNVMHVHSGETHHFSTTKVDEIRQFNYQTACDEKHLLIFTTYHSLHKIQESNIVVDTIYFDEAHNSVQKNFFPATEHFSYNAKRCFFFTATPKNSLTPQKAGMNWSEVYGDVICQVPAPKLVREGYILPPKVEVYKSRILDKNELVAERDCEQMVQAIDNIEKDKVLICAKSTNQIKSLVYFTDFVSDLADRGYSWMTITSKTGAIIDGEKVDRETFFDTLNEWGRDPDKKFVVLHHSILSEGINVHGLEAVLFMRSMDYITISQTIGRVIRKGAKDKVYGMICVPVYSKVGITTARKVEAVVDTIFNKGEAATVTVTR
jgi:superfamily II DNA or RNA helicase